MNLLDGIKSAAHSLRVNKMRSSLTMLGMIIGISSVILISGLGNGMKASILGDAKDQLSGTFTINVDKENEDYQDEYGLDKKDLKLIRELPNVNGASFGLGARLGGKINGETLGVLTMGLDKEIIKTGDLKKLKGRFFTSEELTGNKNIVLIDSLLAKKLFKNEEAVGKYINIDASTSKYTPVKKKFYIIGVVVNPVEKLAKLLNFDNFYMYLPAKTGKNIFEISEDETITVKVKDMFTLDQTMKDVRNILESKTGKKIYKIKKVDDMNFVDDMLTKVSAFVIAIAFISLFVGGIGIMNIMLASVTERIKEIGIRKAIGARNRDILVLFLIEAIFLSVVGGVIGIALGMAEGYLVGHFVKITPVYTSTIIMIAVLVSSFIGILFGVIPARKASKLNPIDALRS